MRTSTPGFHYPRNLLRYASYRFGGEAGKDVAEEDVFLADVIVVYVVVDGEEGHAIMSRRALRKVLPKHVKMFAINY
ncbi:MAG: hypothetical protein AAF741_17385 [Bacteroidota bacterium]